MAIDTEFLAEYINNPALQAKYGNFDEYRNFMGSQKPVEELGIKNIIGSNFQNLQDNVSQGLNFVRDKAGQGFDFAQQLPGMAISAAMNVPFIGQGIMAGLNALQDMTGPNYRAMQEQELSEMGYNIDDIGRAVSGPGDYNTAQNVVGGYNLASKDMVGGIFDRINAIKNRKMAQTKSSTNRIEALKQAALDISKSKRLAYEKAIQDAKNAERAERARVKSISAGYGGHDDRPGATGPTAAGAGMGVGGGYASDYGFLKDGGRVGYANGGLASLFTRRG